MVKFVVGDDIHLEPCVLEPVEKAEIALNSRGPPVTGLV